MRNDVNVDGRVELDALLGLGTSTPVNCSTFPPGKDSPVLLSDVDNA
jgi:hypothetical protein